MDRLSLAISSGMTQKSQLPAATTSGATISPAPSTNNDGILKVLTCMQQSQAQMQQQMLQQTQATAEQAQERERRTEQAAMQRHEQAISPACRADLHHTQCTETQ